MCKIEQSGSSCSTQLRDQQYFLLSYVYLTLAIHFETHKVKKCVQFTYMFIPSTISSLLHTQSTYIFISICVELQLKLFQLNFPLVHATAPGIVRFYFYYVYSSPTNIIVPLLPAYIDRNNNET